MRVDARSGAFRAGNVLGAALLAILHAHAQSAAPQWVPIGPSAVTAEALDIDPTNTNHVIIGTYFGGLYQTYDGAQSWSHIDSIFGTYPVFAVVFDRSQPSTVYAGTFQAGIYKSTDSGRTWAQSSQGLTDFNVQNMAIDPVARPRTSMRSRPLCRSSLPDTGTEAKRGR